MVGDTDLAAVGALIGDPGRARVLRALTDGRELPASVLAAEAGVAPSTASVHLRKLVDGGLVVAERHGRHRYFRLAGPDVARALEAPIFMPLDVNKPGQMEAVFERITKEWGKLDFVVHSIAFSPKEALQGRVVDVSREGFATTMDVSCWTFIRMAHLAEPLMRKGGTLFTMSYYGSQMVVKNYNIMGVAKAALECAVRYIAAELGPKGIRVHAISPGPLATRAASGIPEFDALLDKAKAKAPARSLVSIDDVGAATAFLAHDAARLITGETLYIDGGYHIID